MKEHRSILMAYGLLSAISSPEVMMHSGSDTPSLWRKSNMNKRQQKARNKSKAAKKARKKNRR